MAESVELNEVGQCYCGAVRFAAKGTPLFNALCHCKPCSRNVGVSPVHLLGIPAHGFEITAGSEHVVVNSGYGTMTHASCKNCSSPIYQCPKDASFRALFPPSFQIEQADGKGCLMPQKFWPKAHVNYENRTYDHNDTLPKYKDFPGPGKEQLANDGTVLPAEPSK